MAAIRQKGPESFHVQIRMKGFKAVTRTFPTRKLAEEFAKVTEADMLRGTFIPRREADHTTLGEILTRYLGAVTPRKKGAKQEAVRIRRWLKHPLAKEMLSKVQSSDIAHFRDDWRKAGKAENTIRLEILLLSHVFNTARKDFGFKGLENPCSDITLPATSNERNRRFQDGEEGKLLEELRNARNPYIASLVQFAVATAMRQGELLSLPWGNVNIEKRTAYLPTTKNDEARTVPLSTIAIKILSALPRSEDRRVFPLEQHHVRTAWDAACKRAGIVDFRFHDLRHEATSRIFELGVFDSMEVAAITGHKTLQVLKRYVHFRPEDLAIKLG